VMPVWTPRAMWALFEPIHAVTYFAAPARDAFEAAGLRGFWRGYFAGRAAPLGPTSAPVVTALFFGFSPRMVDRALPAVWDVLPPRGALRARQDGATAALRALPRWPADDAALAQAAELAQAAARAATTDGRALGAANAALPWPQEPIAVLWQAATVLRELRGDGHVTALLAAGLNGLDSVVLRAGLDVEPAVQQHARGWSDEDWHTKIEALRGRGFLDSQARVTPAGRKLLGEVEALTNELAAEPWDILGAREAARFADLVRPFSAAALAAFPPSTPLGRISAEDPV
jgi:hypothetical protein